MCHSSCSSEWCAAARADRADLCYSLVEGDQRREQLLLHVGQLGVFVSALVLHGLQRLHLLLRGAQPRQQLVGLLLGRATQVPLHGQLRLGLDAGVAQRSNFDALPLQLPR